MAPELWEEGTDAEKGYTNAVDIWALGIIIYEIFNKKHLIKGYTETMVKNDAKNFTITEETLKNIPNQFHEII